MLNFTSKFVLLLRLASATAVARVSASGDCSVLPPPGSPPVVTADVDVPGLLQGPHLPRLGRAVLATRPLFRLGRSRPDGATLVDGPPPAAEGHVRTLRRRGRE